jgi:Tol biopolymer transport system component
MSLVTGTRVGSLEIVGAIGAGGMGEVYRAHDSRLQRDVAVKVVPEAFALDPDRLTRFEREAQVLASLNHPNIAQVYGIERVGDTHALLMELVEGEDLSARIARGPLPVDEALHVAAQIVDALEAAHERGIVHRDLKPANIKVRSDGVVKVLDFGLAKAMDPAGTASLGLENSPTFLSPVMTGLGMIIGTAAYMAPEQAKGKAVDKRADIWAFGVVLFEMLAGQSLFGGETGSEVLAAVIKEEPRWQLLAAIPSSVERVLRVCLQKDPKLRLRDIGDVRILLQYPEAAAASPAAVQPAGVSRFIPWGIAAGAVIVSLALWMTGRGAATGPTPMLRFVVQPPEGTTASDPVLSPDGRFLVYRAGRAVYLHRFSELESRLLPGTKNASQLFISPDGKWIGFYADGKMKKVSVTGGDALVICDVDADSPGARWISGNRILFSSGWTGSPLMTVSADGGIPQPLTTLDAAAGERGHWWPEPLPDSRHVLFTIWNAATGLNEAEIAVLDLNDGSRRKLFKGAMPRYIAGRILYYHAGGYHLIDFDVDALATRGDAHDVLPDAVGLKPQGSQEKPVSIAANGTIAYLTGELFPEVAVAWIDRRGAEVATTTKGRFYYDGDLSPDGERLAAGVMQGGTSSIWIYDLVHGGEQRIYDAGSNRHPVWHPDGQQLAVVSMRKGDYDVLLQPVNGSPSSPMLSDERDQMTRSWSPDGRQLIVSEWKPDGATLMSSFEPASGASRVLVSGPFEKSDGRISPDGRWLAYGAAPGDRWQLFVLPMTGAPVAQQISSGTGGTTYDDGLIWSARSRELFYLRNSALTVLTYEERNGRFFGLKEAVVATLPRGSRLLGVSPDAERLLISRPSAPPSTAQAGIKVVVNGLSSVH